MDLLLRPSLQVPSSRPEVGVAFVVALVVHQLFRRFETYSTPVHASLLVFPPTVVACLLDSASWGFLISLRLYLTSYITSLILAVVLYRLSPFHPLAKYPGPVACKISKFWLAGIAFRGYQHHYLKRLHERYGDVVRIGPNELSVRDPALVPALLGPSGAPKGPQFFGRLLSDKILTMVALQDPEAHMHRRRSWGRGFTPTAVKGYEGFISARIRQLVTQLEQRHGIVQLEQWLNYFSFDFMTDMAFGGGSNLLGGNDQNPFWVILNQAMQFSTFLGHVPWLGVMVGHVPLAKAGIDVLLAESRELVRRRVQRGSLKRDLFHYLNHEDQPDKPSPPLEQLVDDGILAMIAGADTVSSALASLFSCLLEHPEVYAKLQAEVDRFYPPGEDALSTKHHKEMLYLNAVINETLRVFPSIPACTQRQLPRGGNGLTAGSHYIPPGTVFWIHAYSIHRDPRNFYPAPESFVPERWLVASGHLPQSALFEYSAGTHVSHPSFHSSHSQEKPGMGAFVHDQSAFVAFSHGPMNCVGKHLALQEMRMVVCALLQRFRLRAGEGWNLKQYENEFRDFFVTARGEVPVVLEVRVPGRHEMF